MVGSVSNGGFRGVSLMFGELLSARQNDRIASRQGRKLLGTDGRSVGRLIYLNTVLREEEFRDFAPDREVYILRNIADRISDEGNTCDPQIPSLRQTAGTGHMGTPRHTRILPFRLNISAGRMPPWKMEGMPATQPEHNCLRHGGQEAGKCK